MPRPQRELKSGFCYHITTRCNNREFRLTRLECREVFFVHYEQSCTLPAGTQTARGITQNYALAQLVYCHVL